MKYILILAVVMLSACSTVTPVPRNFPAAPDELKAACAELQLVPAGTVKLSEVVSTVTKNYGQYHDCKNRVDAWNEWYNTQKQIFDSVK
jgi:hypothetical protein